MKIKGLLFLLLFALASCNSKEGEQAAEEDTVVITAVTLTTINREPIADSIEMNATSAFLKRSFIKSNSNGYITSVNIQQGKMVSAGQTAFVLKTKEAQSIGDRINLLDSSFKFSGIINIRAATGGYVSEVSHQLGDFVQEGEQLAVITDTKSLVFILNLPYELRPYVLNKQRVVLLLPDGKSITGNISSALPLVDSASQTQSIIITVPDTNIPANLIAKVKVAKTEKMNAVSLPKQSVLSDETQQTFWVMKLINDSTAIRIPVTKGVETGDRVEILTPAFSDADQFLLTGNYGLPDTALIKIMRQ